MDIKEKRFFPRVQKSIETFLNDEEGNIPRNKLLMIGSMVILMGILFMNEAFAAHRSHSSHSSHSSHKSHSSHRSHSNHSNHGNHSNMPTVPSLNTPRVNEFIEEIPAAAAALPMAPQPTGRHDIPEALPQVSITSRNQE